MNHSFTLINADTDSIAIGKPDGSPFSDAERQNLLAELNSNFPSGISWADDGYFSKAVIFKAKNYILFDPTNSNIKKQIKSKGSALKSGNKEIALREFIQETVASILHDRNDFVEIYHRYIKEALDVKDIKRWASRKNLSAKTYSSERKNESRIIDAIAGKEYREGDRIWTYFTADGSLKLIEDYSNDCDTNVLLKKLYNTSKLFESVLDHKLLYVNYSLKRSQPLLAELLK